MVKKTFSLKNAKAINNALINKTIKNIINNKKNKEKYISYINLIKYYYKSMLYKKDMETKNNLRKYKLLNAF